MALANSTAARNAMPPTTLHPFFTKGQSAPAGAAAIRANRSTEITADAKPAITDVEPPDEKENLPAASFFAPRTGNARQADPHSMIELQPDACLEEDPNESRRKRRKSSDGRPEGATPEPVAATRNGLTSLDSLRCSEPVQAPTPFQITPHAVRVLIPQSENSSSPPGDAGLSKSDTTSHGTCGSN